MKADIERLVGASGGLDVNATGIWFRVQPKGLGLDHRSETSEGDLDLGVHVFATLAQAVHQEGRWLYLKEGDYELVVITGPEQLADTGDVEGWVLPLGTGRIIGRFDYTALVAELDD
jgi:hypothetical protein